MIGNAPASLAHGWSHSACGMAAGSIHIASQMWPSGSARLRLYMKPRSCAGLMSAVPPFEAAALFMASTASRLSQDSGKHHFARRCGRDGAGREGAPLGVREQHDVDRLAPHHARGRVVGEVRVVLETEGVVEGHRGLEVCDREVHENHLGHVCSFLRLLLFLNLRDRPRPYLLEGRTRIGLPDTGRKYFYQCNAGSCDREVVWGCHENAGITCSPKRRIEAMFCSWLMAPKPVWQSRCCTPTSRSSATCSRTRAGEP